MFSTSTGRKACSRVELDHRATAASPQDSLSEMQTKSLDSSLAAETRLLISSTMTMTFLVDDSPRWASKDRASASVAVSSTKRKMTSLVVDLEAVLEVLEEAACFSRCRWVAAAEVSLHSLRVHFLVDQDRSQFQPRHTFKTAKP